MAMENAGLEAVSQGTMNHGLLAAQHVHQEAPHVSHALSLRTAVDFSHT